MMALLVASPPLPRYRAVDDRVICDFGGGAFLVCTINEKIAGDAPLAQLLADALNRNPMLADALNRNPMLGCA